MTARKRRAAVVCGRAPLPEDVTAVAPDWSPETDLDRLAGEAQSIVTDVRQMDPLLVRRTLAMACVLEPTRMAQILMVLGAWVSDVEPLSERQLRVLAIARGVPA